MGRTSLRERLSAWVLLLAFVPMAMLSLAHTHHVADIAAMACDDCYGHPAAHHAHVTVEDLAGLDHCVLHQLASVPFVALEAPRVAVPRVVAATVTFAFVARLCEPGRGVSCLRGPPNNA